MTDKISRAEVLKVLREEISYLESIELTEHGEGALGALRLALQEIERMPSVGESDGKERLNQPG